jgi:hypothetical protein
MFIGYFGIGLAAKGIDRKPSLGTLIMAVLFVELILPLFQLLGLEKIKFDLTAFIPLNFEYYPFTYSLETVIILGLLFGLVYYFVKRNYLTSLLLFFLVFSYWVIDFIGRIPELPFFPWKEDKVVMGYFNSSGISLAIEIFIFVTGACIYIYKTYARNEKGLVGIWSLLVFLIAVYFLNVFDSPMSSTGSITYTRLTQWIFVIWGYWADKHRTSGQLRHYEDY